MFGRKLMSWVLTLAILLPILVSCKDDGSDPELTRELKALAADSRLSDEGRKEAQNILNLHKEVQQTIRANPTLKALPKDGKVLSHEKALKLHTQNQTETIKVLEAQDAALKKFVDNVKSISKRKFSENLDAAQTAESETLVLMNLLVVRHVAQSASRRILFLMTKFDKPYFDQLDENAEMKQRLLADYSSALAVAAVSANDLRTTLTQLRELREAGAIIEPLEIAINKVVSGCGGHERLDKKNVDEFMKESLTQKAQGTMDKAMTDYHRSLKGKTFLFDPAHPDHPLIHVLVIVSNLSWGLVNTLVGLGFVITAAIVAPITQVAGAGVRAMGYEPLFYEMRMPKLAIAQSNMQIYADVCGLGFIPSKMSAGLFELDFCTGQSFASHHEAGHAKQSALLGPLYFPAAILSYMLNMGHGGFIEDWADAWATT